MRFSKAIKMFFSQHGGSSNADGNQLIAKEEEEELIGDPVPGIVKDMPVGNCGCSMITRSSAAC